MDDDRFVRTYSLSPDSPWTWLAALLTLVAAVALAILFFWVFVGVFLVSLIAAPILRWKLRRKLRKAQHVRTEGGRRVIEVEYEIE